MIMVTRLLCMLLLGLALTACESNAGKQAVSGGTTGALVGAVGGAFTALIFGGDVVDAAARGAVYGGATGATAGAIAGSQKDKQIEQRQAAQTATTTATQTDDTLEALRRKIGGNAYAGLAALAECDHETALLQAGAAQRDSNPAYALAGLWLQVLSNADKGDEAGARALFPTIVEKDDRIASSADAEAKMREGLNTLMDIREQYDRPRVCTG